MSSEHYFRFAMPTFRFFHQQTLERWMEDLISRKPLALVRAASVLIVWAQALIYSEQASAGDQQLSRRSLSYFDQARTLLNNEPGPAQLASVESRIATCLYLLSISRINECRFLFGFTHTLVMALGLHRKTSRKRSLSSLEAERRKRAFWSFYDLDCYLSVMLGQPRQLHDEDVDQEYPINIEDHVLDTAADLTQVPHHGNVEAFIYHTKLSRCVARGNDLLYPIHQLTKEEIIGRGAQMVKELDQWEHNLPAFLKPRASASLGTQTWERQNSVLGLALAHARILATRRCLLVDVSASPPANASGDGSGSSSSRHAECVRVCVNSIRSIIDRVHPMIQHGRLLWGFWMTQYIAMCAISTLFVYKIQRRRGGVSQQDSQSIKDQDQDLAPHFQKAEEVQEYLSRIALQGSQAKRHHNLLRSLRQRANNETHRTRRVTDEPQRLQLRQAGDPTISNDPAYSEPNAILSSSAAAAAAAAGTDSSAQPPRMPPLTEMFSEDTSASTSIFTPSNLPFDFAFPDAESWQYLDSYQLGLGSGSVGETW
jgi:hypothetical protein